MSTPSETIRTETSQLPCPAAKRAIRADASGASLVTTSGRSPATRASRSASASACSLSAAITSPPASGWSPARIRSSRSTASLQHVRDPVAVGVERRAQPPRRLGGGQPDREVGAAPPPVRHPLHLAVVEVERDRPADVVEQRVGVAVGEVGLRDAVGVVADPRDRRVVRAERRAREQQPEARGAERLDGRCGPTSPRRPCGGARRRSAASAARRSGAGARPGRRRRSGR